MLGGGTEEAPRAPLGPCVCFFSEKGTEKHSALPGELVPQLAGDLSELPRLSGLQFPHL